MHMTVHARGYKSAAAKAFEAAGVAKPTWTRWTQGGGTAHDRGDLATGEIVDCLVLHTDYGYYVECTRYL